MPRGRTPRAVATALGGIAVVALIATAADRRAAAGTLELRVAVVGPLPDDLQHLEARPAWAGANRAAARDEGWTRVAVAPKTAVLPVRATPGEAAAFDGDADRRPATMAEGRLPAGSYARVHVAAPDIVGVTADGRRLPLQSHVEPIALDFAMPARGRVSIDIEWTVLPASRRSGGTPEVFVRHAREAGPAGRATQEQEVTQMMAETDVVAAVERYFELACGPDAAAFQALFAPDAMLEDPVGVPALTGPEGAAKFHRGLRRAWSSLRMTVRETFVRGDVAAVLWSARGTSAGGADIAFDGIDVIAFDDEGRIRKLEGYWDLASVLARM